MKRNLIYLFTCIEIIFASGGFDGGTSAGKGKWNLSCTLNPSLLFKEGQSYIIFGYGVTEKIDIHGYYSKASDFDNYYAGLFYQFLDSKFFDLSTAIGLRKYNNKPDVHFFAPQLLYTVKLTNKINIAGSFVNIRTEDLKNDLGTTIDIFFSHEIYNDKIKIDFSIGLFKPSLWKPEKGDFHPTYSFDFQF